MYSYVYSDTLEDFRKAVAFFAGENTFSPEAVEELYNYYKAWEDQLGMALHVDLMELRNLWTEKQIPEGKAVQYSIPVGNTGRLLQFNKTTTK